MSQAALELLASYARHVTVHSDTASLRDGFGSITQQVVTGRRLTIELVVDGKEWPSLVSVINTLGPECRRGNSRSESGFGRNAVYADIELTGEAANTFTNLWIARNMDRQWREPTSVDVDLDGLTRARLNRQREYEKAALF